MTGPPPPWATRRSGRGRRARSRGRGPPPHSRWRPPRAWPAAPLGDPPRLPRALRQVTGLLLASRFPMFVAWGPELGFLYNDAYAEILGAKHPAALGTRFQEIWAEIWPDISPLID